MLNERTCSVCLKPLGASYSFNITWVGGPPSMSFCKRRTCRARRWLAYCCRYTQIRVCAALLEIDRRLDRRPFKWDEEKISKLRSSLKSRRASSRR